MARPFLISYVALPELWKLHERKLQNGAIAIPKATRTKQGIPGDPLNVMLVGSRDDVMRAMKRAGWDFALSLSLRSRIGIVESALFGKADTNAPVSALYVYGRVEDLVFEQTLNGNARRRHHVRFWLTPNSSADGRDVWIGAVTFDRSVGVSHFTGAITHHIAPDLDAERARLMGSLRAVGELQSERWEMGLGATMRRRNGGGDLYFTDGKIAVGVLKDGG